MSRLRAALATPATARLPRDHGHLALIDASFGYLRQFTQDAARAAGVEPAVPGSRRYADPTAYLIPPAAWPAQRAEFCALVGAQPDPDAALPAVDAEFACGAIRARAVLAGGQGPVRVDSTASW